MFNEGIIDPYKVVRLALESATHIASTLIDKEVFIITLEDKKDEQK
jgi:chaperonin GroEL (HSP60 family)